MFVFLNILTSMNPEEPEFPPADAVEREAEEMPLKLPLRNYKRAMDILREKGYSYQEVADWISKQLGVTVTRNQAAYIINLDPDIEREEDAAEQAAEEEAKRS
jgi:hypothetical protein